MKTERELINNLMEKSHFIGDDCCAIPLNKKESYLITKDVMAENVHFSLGYFTPADIIENLFIRNISDIISSGGVPEYAFIGAALTKEYFNKTIKKISSQIFKCCRKYGIELAGGDTVMSKKNLFFSMTLIGKAPNNEIKTRKGINAGDYLCLLGIPGKSAYALKKLKKGSLKFKKWHTSPKLFINESRILARSKNVRAMIDLSDSLKETVEILCNLNKIGCRIDINAIPSWKEMTLKERQIYSLCGGEDYALLFALDGRRKIKGVNYKIIGTFTEDKNIVYLSEEKEIKIKNTEFKHF